MGLREAALVEAAAQQPVVLCTIDERSRNRLAGSARPGQARPAGNPSMPADSAKRWGDRSTLLDWEGSCIQTGPPPQRVQQGAQFSTPRAKTCTTPLWTCTPMAPAPPICMALGMHVAGSAPHITVKSRHSASLPKAVHQVNRPLHMQQAPVRAAAQRS